MKTLLEFLVKKNVEKTDVFITIPKTTGSAQTKYKIVGEKQIKVEDKPVVIYKDRYHNKLHVSSVQDMVLSLGADWDDYEDFSEKDIIASFDTFEEAAKYALNDIKKNKEHYYDSDSWLESAAEGYENENDGYDLKPSEYKGSISDIIDSISNFADIEK